MNKVDYNALDVKMEKSKVSINYITNFICRTCSNLFNYVPASVVGPDLNPN